MTTLAIHQPGYLPWLGFFKKMMDSDIFVFLDDVQWTSGDWYNRNQIRSGYSSIMLTVPVCGHRDLKLNQVKIDNTKHWQEKHYKSIALNYGKLWYFNKYRDFINSFYRTEYEFLIDLDIDFIKFVMNELEINTKLVYASDLPIKGSGPERIVDMINFFNADTYISGTVWAKDHLPVKDIKMNVKLQNYIHPSYSQPYKTFMPNMSILDLLINEGPNARNILTQSKWESV